MAKVIQEAAAAAGCACLASAVLASVGLAQTYPTYPWPQAPTQGAVPGTTQQAQPQQPTGQGSPNQPGAFVPPLPPWDPRSVRALTLDDMPGQPRVDPRSLFPTWVRPDAAMGFPVFPPSLGMYSVYPAGPGGSMQLPTAGGQLPPPSPPTSPDWPTWVKAKKPGMLPYEPTVAVLVRQADRVWWRSAADEPFVPLYHYDNARALGAGSQLEVRNTGEFMLMLHGGTRISSMGTAKIGLQVLSETEASVTVSELTWMTVRASTRGIRIALPDGSDLLLDAPKDVSEGGPGIGDAGIRIERQIDPGRYVGSATIFNFGDRMARWITPLGEVRLYPGYRATMLLHPCDNALAGNLEEASVAALQDGEKRVWRAAEDGSVTWSGAQFQLPRGAQLVLDPMLGDPFGRRSVVAPAGAAPVR